MTLNQFGNSGPYQNGSIYAQPRDGGRDPGRDPGRDLGRDGGYESAHELPDEPMERIRELILGDMRRTWESRLQMLETRLQLLEDKLEAVRHDAHADRQGHLAALAEGIDDLGQHVRRLSRP